MTSEEPKRGKLFHGGVISALGHRDYLPLSYVCVILAFALVRPQARPSTIPPGNVVGHIVTGFRFVMRRRWMVGVLLSLGAASFIGFSGTVLYPAVARDVLGRQVGTYGLLLSLTGLGAAAGAPVVTFLNRFFAKRGIIRGSLRIWSWDLEIKRDSLRGLYTS